MQSIGEAEFSKASYKLSIGNADKRRKIRGFRRKSVLTDEPIADEAADAQAERAGAQRGDV
jgi:hypothetical protein